MASPAAWGLTVKPVTHEVTAMAKGPGFKAVQSKIAAKQGIPKKNAGAILAASTRKASPAAKRKNPNLLKVK
jgi:hypothetical protein